MLFGLDWYIWIIVVFCAGSLLWVKVSGWVIICRNMRDSTGRKKSEASSGVSDPE